MTLNHLNKLTGVVFWSHIQFVFFSFVLGCLLEARLCLPGIDKAKPLCYYLKKKILKFTLKDLISLCNVTFYWKCLTFEAKYTVWIDKC